MPKQLRGTSVGGLAKYAAPFIDAVTDSMRSGTPLRAGSKNYVIRNVKENIQTLNEWLKLAASSTTEKKAIDLILVTTKQEKIPIGAFDKPKKGEGWNTKGDVAEGIVGAAIAARFVNKNRDINARDIQRIIEQMVGSGSKRETMYKSQNANPKIVDDVRFYLSLAKPNMDALCDPKNFTPLEDLFESAVKYANGKTVREWGDILYNNNMYNFIEVISDGLGGQRSTKVDVRVLVDKQHTDINVSLKAGDVKQFGQVSGAEFDKQEILWEKLLKIDVKFLEREYTQLLSEKKTFDAIFKVYNYVTREINSRLATETSRAKFLDDLGEGIIHFATLNEKDVTLVQLNRKEAKVYNFDGLKKAILQIKELRADIVSSGEKPKIVIGDRSTGVLLEIRTKIENKSDGTPYIRNYIEKGKLLGDLIANYA
jgi:hypothetical protein